MYELPLNGTLDLNINLNGAGSDTGLTYSVAPGCAGVVSVNASTGVVTPAAVGFAVVLVKNASNTVVKKVPVSVLSAAEYTVRQQIASGAVTLAQGIAAANS